MKIINWRKEEVIDIPRIINIKNTQEIQNDLKLYHNKTDDRTNKISIPLNHPIKQLIFNIKYSYDKYSNKNVNNEYEIFDLCNQLKKLYIPKTYNEYISLLSDSEKQKIEQIDYIEKKWCETLYEINII